MTMPISAADHVAQVIEGRGQTKYVGSTRIMSVRIPAQLFYAIQALSVKSGRTRNATIGMLLDVGLQEVTAKLSRQTALELEQMQAQFFNESGEADD